MGSMSVRLTRKVDRSSCNFADMAMFWRLHRYPELQDWRHVLLGMFLQGMASMHELPVVMRRCAKNARLPMTAAFLWSMGVVCCWHASYSKAFAPYEAKRCRYRMSWDMEFGLRASTYMVPIDLDLKRCPRR